MTVQPMNDETRQLITHLHRGGKFGYFWTVDEEQIRIIKRGKRAGQEERVKLTTWFRIARMPAPPNGETQHVYFGVHPTVCTPQERKNYETGEVYKPNKKYVRAVIGEIAAVNCLFGEFDAKHFKDGKIGALEHIARLPVAPSVSVDSGGGYHCYWLLFDPFIIGSDADRTMIKRLQNRWVAFIGSDVDAKDLARVLRVPGRKNIKPAYAPHYPEVMITEADFSRLYSIDELAALIPEVVREIPEREAYTPPRDVPEGRYSAYVDAAYQGEIGEVRAAQNGYKHYAVRNAAIKLAGLLWTGCITEAEIEHGIYNAVESRANDAAAAKQTILDGIAYGKDYPREIKDKPMSATQNTDQDTDAQQKPAQRAKEGDTRHTAPTADKALLLPSQVIMHKLHDAGFRFALDLSSGTVEVNGKPIDDITRAKIRTYALDAELKPLSAIEDVYTANAFENAYHPIKDYLNALKWDGSDHILEFAHHFTSDDPHVKYDDGLVAPLHFVYLKRWLVGAVAKVLDCHQNLMLVLSGPQGIGKSELARWLCSGIPDRFIEAPLDVHDKDSNVRLMSRFIWEVSELDATTRRADVSALKAFITTNLVTVRKAYGHHDTIKPAIASMIGTVNPGSGFLADESGSRRFYVTNITRIDWNYTNIDVGQIWAQAVALFRAGEPWRLLPNEADVQSVQNQSYTVDTPLEGWIARFFDTDAGDECLMTAADIITHLADKGVRLTGTDKSNAMEISRILKNKGVEKIRSGLWRGYRGITPLADGDVTTYDNLKRKVVMKHKALESQNDNLDNLDNLKINKAEMDPHTTAAPQGYERNQKKDVCGDLGCQGCHVARRNASESTILPCQPLDSRLTKVVTNGHEVVTNGQILRTVAVAPRYKYAQHQQVIIDEATREEAAQLVADEFGAND